MISGYSEKICLAAAIRRLGNLWKFGPPHSIALAKAIETTGYKSSLGHGGREDDLVHRRIHDLFLGSLAGDEFLDHAPLPADQDPIGQIHDLRQIGRDHDDG